MSTESVCRALRPGLDLAATWRVLTELWRRHARSRDLRLLQTHPGVSERGQWCLLLGPRVGSIVECPRLVLNLGGPVGTYAVQIAGQVVAEGDYLWPMLTDDPAAVVDRLERQLGLHPPAALPPSTAPVLVMRLLAEVLAAASLDRNPLTVEPAWFDWSGGVRVKPWATLFGHPVSDMQQGLDAGRLDWQQAYLDVASLLRIAPAGPTPPVAWLADMNAGTLICVRQGEPVETVDIAHAYAQAKRRLEPLAAKLLVTLRGGPGV